MRILWHFVGLGISWLLLWVLDPIAPAWAQAPSSSVPTMQDHPLRFHNIGNREGLSQMTVTAIVQDALGFLWFGTEEGLNRWDGYRFEIFRHDPNDPGSLPSGSIEAMIVGRSGDLWIGTHRGELVRFDPRTLRSRRYQRSLDDIPSPGDRILSLAQGPGDLLWVGTRTGLSSFDPEEERWRHERHATGTVSLRGERIYDLTFDSSGTLWIAGRNGLHSLEPASSRVLHWSLQMDDDPTTHEIRRLHLDREGLLWLGTWGAGLYRYHPKSGSLDHFRIPGDRFDNEIRSLHRDRHGVVWFGTQGRGLIRLDPEAFDPDGEGISRYRRQPSEPHGLAGDSVLALLEDHNGDLWAGTWGFGISRFDPDAPSFEHRHSDPDDPHSLPHSSVRSLLLDRKETLWVGTHGGGLAERRKESQTHAIWRFEPGSPRSIASDTVYALLEDAEGKLWIGSKKGLDVIDAERREVVDRYRHRPEDPTSLAGETVRCLHQDSAGTIWIGTRSSGLDRFEPEDETFVHHRHQDDDPQSLPGDRIFVIHEDPEGTLWVGTSHGLARRLPDEDGRAGSLFVSYINTPGDPHSLRSDVVLALFSDSHGTLWVGTQGGGLSRFDDASERFTAFTESDGLANNVVYAIAEDGLGRLWSSTNRGLSRFDPVSESFSNYDPDDGLPVYEFNTGAVVRYEDGRLSFGGVLGLVTFTPESFRDNPLPPNVVLTRFEIFQKQADLALDPPYVDRVTLAHDENFFSFEFAALDFRRPSKNRYAYRLEGLDGDWIQAGTRRFAAYTAVPPGEYIFRVKASNDDGVWNEDGIGLAITIERPLWQRWWAYLLYFSTAVIALASFVVIQRRKVEHERRINRRFERLLDERTRDLHEREQLIHELERFTHTVSHDLRNPLFTIKSFVGRALFRAEQQGTATLIDDLQRVGSAADQLDRLLDELTHFTRVGRSLPAPEPVALEPLVRGVLERFEQPLRRARGTVAVEPGLPTIEGDPVLLQVVFQSLLDNALKFSGDSPPRIELGWRDTSEDPTASPAAVRGPHIETESTAARWVELSVRDHGIGIPAAYHERIFDLFERLSPEPSEGRPPGTGIGLALARRILEAHGGRLWVESEGPGRGSTFRFLLRKSGI